jgi:hypothetical protein
MAKTIGQLTQATTLASGDEFVIEQSGLTKRVAASVVRGGLINSDIDAAAAIAFSKLAALDSANILVGNGSNVATKVAVTGDVTISNAGVTAIGSSKVVTAMVNNGAITAAKLDGAQTGSAPIYGCRAWVFFNGTTSPPTINASGNVTSVTKNGVGDYTVNFTTALPNANYAAAISRSGGSNGVGAVEVAAGRSTTGYRLTLVNVAVNANVDEANISAVFFG